MNTIIIVGGGVAGLALAAALDPQRWRVTLIEQRPVPTDVGTAFGIWPVAQRALAFLGLGDWLTAECVRVTDGAIRQADNKPIVQMRGVDMALVSRPELLRALDAAVPASVERVKRRVEDPRDLSGDVVVAADGARSRVRAAIWGDTATPVGTWAVRGVLPRPAEVIDMAEYWGGRVLFGISPASAHMTNWYATIRHDPGPPEAALDALRQTHRDFPAPVRRVLAEAEAGRTLVNRILISPLTRRLVRGRHVLIGDAAHAMSPSLGRGACEALVDAVALAHELNRRDPETGLRAYQRQRLIPGQAVRTAASVALRLQEAGPRVHRLLATLG
ncbi:FAD-dependent oxidoreductase [Granulicoccus sp. GXG6511]|uniref:FAD-dependent oxidoreductase n=1 Tax=Granulicoccus sp. GXG6511 TaxID=3381351 RepID=UPI003D7D34E0